MIYDDVARRLKPEVLNFGSDLCLPFLLLHTLREMDFCGGRPGLGALPGAEDGTAEFDLRASGLEWLPLGAVFSRTRLRSRRLAEPCI